MRKLVAVIALVAGVTACSMNTDTPTTPLVGDISGTYALQSMNGTPLPFSIVSHDTTVLIDTDSLVVFASGDWAEKVTYRQTVGTNATTNESFTLDGFWSRQANTLHFNLSQGLLYVGTATESTLELADGFFKYSFKR